ncbi:Gag-pol Polyprotein [Phytophthora megakarya]|uniref:Gag-pol Polyprotein n=1 Tax=Phytophthora megakarya TaxID=4795 RepID=A0A225W5D8_9STRA|nr:Gag-pol Polyprotein [Phytophthora megakarya]
MFSDITKYVKGCETFARTKARHEKPPGLLNSHDIPVQRWSYIAMDFITGLPTTPRDYDSVMVVIDHLTKRAHFVAGKGTDAAIDVAVRFDKEIFRLHGLPNVVVSDRDAKFT